MIIVCFKNTLHKIKKIQNCWRTKLCCLISIYTFSLIKITEYLKLSLQKCLSFNVKSNNIWTITPSRTSIIFVHLIVTYRKDLFTFGFYKIFNILKRFLIFLIVVATLIYTNLYIIILKLTWKLISNITVFKKHFLKNNF